VITRLVARLFFLYAAAPAALDLVAWTGLATAFLAATMALVAYDIKRVLAFSTVSQLGYMMIGLGAGDLTAGMFHLTTHAFFKALLFLGAGSVIHAVHTNDMRQMGGLQRKMPVTFVTFGIATLAIAGIPPLSGFYSKDRVLAAAHGRVGESVRWHAFGPAVFLGIIGVWAATLVGWRFRWDHPWMIRILLGFVALLFAYWGYRVMAGTVP